MNTFTRHSLVTISVLLVQVALAIIVLVAPAYTLLTHSAIATASPTISAIPIRRHDHSGPDYWSVTGARVGAPSESEVSTYGGSHKHLWVEQQLYGPGIVHVPQVDTTVHQSR